MIGLLLALLAPAHADETVQVAAVDGAQVADELTEEIARQQAELALPDAPPLYHLRYQLLMLHEVDAVAANGGLIRYRQGPSNGLGVEVRVGTPDFDNTGFGGWQNGFVQGPLPDELTPLSARLGAWRFTDTAYKQAVEQYARKTSQFTAPEDHPGDYQMVDPVTGAAEVPQPLDGEPLQALAISLSEALDRGPRTLERGEVHVGHELGALWTLDSTGTRVRRPVAETTIRALGQLRTADGMLLTDQRLWSVREPSQLPAPEAMAADARAVADGLAALAEAPVLDDEYVGPVLFTDEAAVDLFRYLLVAQLEGTPAEVPFDSWFGDLGGNKDPVRVGRRVLPPGWSAFDDPGHDPSHPSAFQWDLEGTPAERVDLVSDGIVRDVLMSRVPRKGVDGTNGHARGWIGERPEGRVSQLVVTPPRSESARKLHKRAAKLARAYGRDWYFVVERLQEPAVRQIGQGYSMFAETSDGALPPPVRITRVWADGRTEVLRGARIVGVERWLLRDIVAAGELNTGTWLAPTGSFGSGATSGLPVLTLAPDVLVGEVEIVPSPGDPRDANVLEPPK